MVRGPSVRVCLSLVCAGLLSIQAAMAATPADQVAAHLAAGEFGPAAEQAAKVADPVQQAELLQQVATAQQQAGAPAAARATLRQIGTPDLRGRAQGQLARQQSLGGGNAMMGFMQLMNVLQDNTSGQWETTDGVGGKMTPWGLMTGTGVMVSADGVLSRATTQDATGRLALLASQARKASLNQDMAQPTSMRLISLKRLEAEVARRLSEGLPIPQSMAYLGGMTRLQYVFIDTDAHDIILGGPAEAWRYTDDEEPVGLESGRPTLQLDDLVTLLRSDADFGCSINTRDAGVKALQDYVQQSQARGPLSAGGGVRNWVNMLQKKLGRQDVVLWGVNPDSRVARVIVAADYRMKLIGIDKLEAGASIPSYFDLLPLNLQKDPPAMEALRWWLTMNYDAIYHSPDRTAFEIQGTGVKCLSENQMLTAEGKHLPTGKAEQTNRLFASNFTSHYDELAHKDLVFADTQNVFDLALVAALIRQEKLDQKTGIDLGVFKANGTYQPARYAVPRELDSVVNHRVYNNRDVVVQVAGGVHANLRSVVKDQQLAKEAPRLRTPATPTLPAGRWWWDAAK